MAEYPLRTLNGNRGSTERLKEIRFLSSNHQKKLVDRHVIGCSKNLILAELSTQTCQLLSVILLTLHEAKTIYKQHFCFKT